MKDNVHLHKSGQIRKSFLKNYVNKCIINVRHAASLAFL